jgi:hypothetical protein
MKFSLILLLFPYFITAQINPAFVVKSNLSYTKVESSGDGMFGFEKDGKFGYLDKNGNVVIPANYVYESNTKTIPGFQKGMVKLKKDKKYGVLDKTGKTIIPFEYDGLYTSNGKYISVYNTINGKNTWGVVSMQNKVLIPIAYDQLQVDSNLIGVKQNGKWGMKDVSGKEILPIEFESLTPYAQNQVILAQKGSQYGFIDAKGKWLFEKVKSVYTLNGCYQGMIVCIVNGKHGYLDMKGNEVITTKYDNAHSFNKLGLAKVGKKSTGTNAATLWGYIDKKGNEVIPVQYESIGEFYNGFVYAKDRETNRYGFLNKTGKWVLNPVYLDLLSFDEYGGAWVKQTDAKWHYINKTGKDLGTLDDKGVLFKYFGNQGYAVVENSSTDYVLLDNKGSILKKIDDCEAVYNFSYGIGGYKCKSLAKYGFIDVNGNKITNCDFDGFEGFTEAGISKVTKQVDGKNKSGYVDAKGNIILPIVYDNVYNFRDGWGLIYKDGKYYFVDRNGSLKDPPAKYDELIEFRSGYALGKIKGAANEPNKYVYINKDLKEEFTITSFQAFPVWETVAVVSSDNKTYQLMDKTGRIFKTLTGMEQVNFCTGGMLGIREKSKWGYMNDKGEMIVSPKYDTCTGFKYGYGRVKSAGKWGIVDRSGTEIFTTKYDNILPGENGYFIFYSGGWGMMDKTGKVIIQPTLTSVTPFENNRAMARAGKTYAIIKSPLAK